MTQGRDGQMTLFGLNTWSGKTSRELSAPQMERTSERYSKKPAELRTAPFLYLDLREGMAVFWGHIGREILTCLARIGLKIM